MKTYEYKLLKDTKEKCYTVDDLNVLGKEGWRMIWTKFNANNAKQETLLERELLDNLK